MRKLLWVLGKDVASLLMLLFSVVEYASGNLDVAIYYLVLCHILEGRKT